MNTNISKKFQPLISPDVYWDLIDKEVETSAICSIYPLEAGFGVTFGNTLRRILLSGIEGSAVVSVIIDGVNNEFSIIPGVIEDTMRILLNLKQLIIKNSTGEIGIFKLDIKGPGIVTGANFISENGNLEIVNKSLHIATLANDGHLRMNLYVDLGRGYRKAEWMQDVSLQEDNRIFLDSTFAPVISVSFEVSKTRLGKDIDYDKLDLTIETDGTMTPKDAFNYAVSVAMHQFKIMTESNDIEFGSKNISGRLFATENKFEPKNLNMLFGDDFVPELLLKSIDILGLPARAHNCLLNVGIKRIIDLVNMTENEVMGIKNFGKKSYEDLLQIMKDFGLRFSMNIDEKQILSLMENSDNDASE